MLWCVRSGKYQTKITFSLYNSFYRIVIWFNFCKIWISLRLKHERDNWLENILTFCFRRNRKLCCRLQENQIMLLFLFLIIAQHGFSWSQILLGNCDNLMKKWFFYSSKLARNSKSSWKIEGLIVDVEIDSGIQFHTSH